MAADKTLTCRDCGTSFVFTSSEQDFFNSKGFTNEPSRCPACRATRKESQGAGGRSSYSGGGAGGGSRYGGGGSDRQREMFDVVCAQCGKNTQVPFQPRGDRPVYCSDCFRSHQTTSGSR
ncbi:MAG: zinc-ribbon domain containing protein [Chloroflexi bacterium]|nr:zinc-ribbon domain containing protein [Chloroflexota bacterium]